MKKSKNTILILAILVFISVTLFAVVDSTLDSKLKEKQVGLMHILDAKGEVLELETQYNLVFQYGQIYVLSDKQVKYPLKSHELNYFSCNFYNYSDEYWGQIMCAQKKLSESIEIGKLTVKKRVEIVNALVDESNSFLIFSKWFLFLVYVFSSLGIIFLEKNK